MKLSRLNIGFILSHIFIAIYCLAFQVHVFAYILILMYDFFLELLFNAFFGAGTDIGNTAALEKNPDYRNEIYNEYFWNHLTIAVMLIVPGCSSYLICYPNTVHESTAFSVNIATHAYWGVVFIIPLVIRLIDLFLFRVNKTFSAYVLEEILSFNLVRIVLFSIVVIFCGILSACEQRYGHQFSVLLITLIATGNILLNTIFNKEKETVA
ncbi:MAG: hypothetical protein R2794_08635 [Chitinophagales bacterium]